MKKKSTGSILGSCDRLLARAMMDSRPGKRCGRCARRDVDGRDPDMDMEKPGEGDRLDSYVRSG